MSNYGNQYTRPFGTTAQEVYEKGLSPIPLGSQDSGESAKAAAVSGWNKLARERPSQAQIDEWLEKYNYNNIGIGLGTRIGEYQLIAVDIDSEAHQEKIESCLGRLVSGKKGKKGATWFCLADPDLKNKSFKTREDGMIVELLCNGRQTVIPPSKHPEGKQVRYKWLEKSLLEVDLTSLPVFGKGHMLEIASIVNGDDQFFNGGTVEINGVEEKIDGINFMIWAGVGGGGTTHDNRLRCAAHMMNRGWDEDDAVRRLDVAMRRAYERSEVDEEPDWSSITKEHQDMVRGAKEKGFGDRKASKGRKKKPAERVLADWAQSEWSPIVHFGGSFFKYKDGHWPEIQKETMMKEMYEVDDFIKSSDVNNAMNVLSVMTNEFNFGENSADKICFKNGTLHVKDKMLKPWEADDEIMHQLDFDWSSEAQSPTYDKFINWVFDGDEKAIATFEEFAGLTLVDDIRFQKMLYLIGQGSNGKSTLANLISAMHDPEAVSNVAITSLDDERMLTSLVGKLVNISSEQSRLNMTSDDVLKRITGGDPVSVRKLFKEVENKVILKVRFICVANDLPATNDSSYAMRRRLMILNCPNTVQEHERDPDLFDKLMSERPGIMRRWVEALGNLRKRGRFDEPESSKKAVDDYLRENDSVAQWLDAKTVPRPGEFTDVEEAYMDYQEYAKSIGYSRPFAMPVFKSKLRNANVPVRREVIEQGDIVSVVYKVGVTLKNEVAGVNGSVRI